MSEKLTKLMVTTILNQGVKGSEVKDWHFMVREVDGVYFLDLSTSVEISPKTDLTKEEKTSKYLIITFVVAFVSAVLLGAVGALLLDAYLGRDLVIFSTVPSFVAQLIGARFLMKGYYRRKAEEAVQKDEGTGIPLDSTLRRAMIDIE